MRISGYSDFNIKNLTNFKNITLMDFLSSNMEIKGKITSVSSNVIKLLLQNGKEIVANSNIPLDNLLGEEVSFKVQNSENGIVLQPKIEGTSLEKDLNLKIDNYLYRLKIPANDANRDLVKEMIKKNIPVNNENFKFLKEHIASFNVLINLIQEDVNVLEENIENLENEDIQNIVKKVFISKEGKNLQNILPELKQNELQEKDILFLFKNNFKINIQNIKNYDGFADKGETIETIFSKLEEIISKPEKDLVDVKIAENKENISMEKLEPLQNIKNNVKTTIEKIILNLEKEPIVNTEVLKKDVEKLIKVLGLDKEVNIKETTKMDINLVSQKLEFFNKISNEYMYYQVPFTYGEYKNLAEIVINKRNKKEENGKIISIFISLNTHNLNKVDTTLQYNNNELKIRFSLADEKLINIFKKIEGELVSSIQKIGIKSVRVYYAVQSENDLGRKNIFSELEYIDNRFSNFNMWV